MSLVDEIAAQMKQAMLAKDRDRLTALRGIRAAFLEAMKATGAETLPDAEAEAVLRKLAKTRQESISSYTAAGRLDLAEPEAAELVVISSFLPQLADEETTRGWAQAAIAEVGASSPRDMGKVMAALKAQHGATLDGALASKVVSALLKP
jgi:uncharacterized protein YqeY